MFPYCSLATELIYLLLSYRCTPIGSLLFISDQLAAVLHFFLVAVLQPNFFLFFFLFAVSLLAPSSSFLTLPCRSSPTEILSLLLSYRCITIGSLLFISDQLTAFLHLFPYCNPPTELLFLFLSYCCIQIGFLLFISDQL